MRVLSKNILEIIHNKNNLKYFCFFQTKKTSTAINNAPTSTVDIIPSDELLEKQKPNAKQRSLHIAVVGVPNAGKSTFINNLIDHRVCPTSSKVHTTRKANKAIHTSGNVQLVLYDTPGLVTEREVKKHHLEKSFISACRFAVQNTDLIAVIHDISNPWTRNELHPTVLETLNWVPSRPSILILNKIDAIKSKRILLDSVRLLTNGSIKGEQCSLKKFENLSKNLTPKKISKAVGWSNFEDVFMVSSLTGNGLSDVQKYLYHNALERSWIYKQDCSTDEKPEDLIVDSVRARLLDYLPQEIPYKLQSSLEYYSEENNTIYASVVVSCPSPRIEKLICGDSNGRLYQITERVSSDLVETFKRPISLTISTTSSKFKK